MRCALRRDQADDLSQYVCECFDACFCEASVLSEMFCTAGLEYQPRWIGPKMVPKTHICVKRCLLFLQTSVVHKYAANNGIDEC